MSQDMETFAQQLAQRCKTHEEWLTVIRFGLKTLLESPSFLFELIIREAVRENAQRKRPAEEAAIVAHQIFNELGLRLTGGGGD